MATPDSNDHPGVPLEIDDGGRPRFHGCSNFRNYEVLGKLGEGTFGEVYKAKSLKTSHVVALKKILMHNEKDGFPITALREIKLLKMLSHINILSLEEMCVEKPKGDRLKKASMYMVTPYMEHDLAGLLQNPNVHLTEAHIKCYMIQLLEGLRYLHANQILHRDMKAANLLISNKGILQIADFGLARPYDDPPPQPGQGGGEATRDYTTLVVTRWYRPPELLLQLRRYTTAIDLWGVGCVFGEMFKRKPILAGNSDLQQIQLIFDLVGSPNESTMPGWNTLPLCSEGGNHLAKVFATRPGNLKRVFEKQSHLAVSLLSEFLRLDWRKRINAIDALQHPYFSSAPLPAKPSELPQFEDSHELDRRKGGQIIAVPPAPAGGSVGMGQEGDLTTTGNLRGGGKGRLPRSQHHYNRGVSYMNNDRSFDNRNLIPFHDNRGQVNNLADASEHRPSWKQEHTLPPRPPEPLPPPQNFNRRGSGESYYDDQRSRRRQQQTGNIDTYIPNYAKLDGPPRVRDDRRRRDVRYDRDGYGYRREADKYRGPSRRRSRSPDRRVRPRDQARSSR